MVRARIVQLGMDCAKDRTIDAAGSQRFCTGISQHQARRRSEEPSICCDILQASRTCTAVLVITHIRRTTGEMVTSPMVNQNKKKNHDRRIVRG